MDDQKKPSVLISVNLANVDGFITEAYLAIPMCNHWTSQMHHQHGNKPNLAAYVRGQCWVSLAWVVRSGQCVIALLLLSRLVPTAGNSGKLVAAQVLIRGIYQLL